MCYTSIEHKKYTFIRTYTYPTNRCTIIYVTPYTIARQYFLMKAGNATSCCKGWLVLMNLPADQSLAYYLPTNVTKLHIIGISPWFALPNSNRSNFFIDTGLIFPWRILSPSASSIWLWYCLLGISNWNCSMPSGCTIHPCVRNKLHT